MINTPAALLEDAQDSVQYLVYAIHVLSAQAPGGKVPVFTWSLGGVLMQWAFTFYPSVRSQVKNFFALAPDFRGANFAFISNNPLIGEPALYQQAPVSNYLAAFLKAGGPTTAYVPTTVQYSTTDEIVQPETGPNASSVLGGNSRLVSNLLDQDICGSNYTYGHFTGLSHALTASIFKQHLTQNSPVRIEQVDTSKCNQTCNTPTVSTDDCAKAPGIPEFLGNYFAARAKFPIVLTEPAVRAYAQ